MRLKEFAPALPSDGNSQSPVPPHVLRLVSLWYNADGASQADAYRRKLDAAGWKIGQYGGNSVIVDHDMYGMHRIHQDELDAYLDEQQLDELSFLGSPCTKDCSGHRAGYAWSKSKGGVPGNSPFSPSFNNGANLFVAGK
jgi:hypothetical protein